MVALEEKSVSNNWESSSGEQEYLFIENWPIIVTVNYLTGDGLMNIVVRLITKGGDMY